MTPVSNITDVTCQDNLCSKKQSLKPEIITEKKWTEEYEGYNSGKRLTWDHSNLSISLQYGGGCVHPFKVYILDTSEDQKSFVLLLEDQIKDDHREALIRDVIHVDLKDYAKPGTMFKVMNLSWGHSAIKIGESTFG
jgi:hypothetical protein